MADRPDRQEDFDAAWARIVAALTSPTASDGTDIAPGAGPSDAQDRADHDGSPGPGPAGAAAVTPTDRAPAEPPAPGSQAGLERLFEPLRRTRRPEPPAPSPAAPDAFVDNWQDEGHFTPPEPPEFPAGTPVARLGWAGTIGGPVILLLIALTGWDPPRIVSIGAGLAFLAGFATLVWLLPESREDGWDDGARL
ncbi:MAG: hypothetical protein WCF36_01750 [Candidatus Nanopelagicales bacterium]